ncbi:MAG: BrnT family toxin [Nitrospira sp.]
MTKFRVSGCDWDGGNRMKCQKHGVSITEIEALFTGSPRVAPDPKHSTHEDRFVAVGRTRAGRPLFVVFTIRTRGQQHLLRPVAARYMHDKEVNAYEKEKSSTPEKR